MRLVLGLMILGSAVGVFGCATVQPWERELHAKRAMQVDPDPAMSALDQHVYEYREGASGGYGAQSGSGCGCN